MTFSEDTISREEMDQLKDSEPIYSYINMSNWIKNNMYRYLHKDTESFEEIWNNTNTVPRVENHFYQQFPKKATSLDGEHHYSNFNMYGYCSRWLPAFALNLLFPFQGLIYEEKIKRKLIAKDVPTSVECSLCDELKGLGIWDRKGNWTCVKGGESMLVEFDEMGLKFFQNFNEFMNWKKSLNSAIQKAVDDGMDEIEIRRLEEFKKHSNVPRDRIVEY